MRFWARLALILAQIALLSELAYAQTDEALLKKLNALEKRVLELEALVEQNRGISSGADQNPTTARRPKLPAESNRIVANQGIEPQTRNASPNAGNISNPESPSTDRDDTINSLGQEAFIARDDVPTLKKNSSEMSVQLGYGINSGQLQNDRSFSASTALRYGVTDRTELSINLPYYFTERVTNTSPSTSVTYNTSSLGDVKFGVSHLVSGQRNGMPGMSISGAVSAPTGESPYVFGETYQIGRVPINPLRSYQSVGHWGIEAGTQFFMTVDPVILFWGAGIGYLFDREDSGHTISRGLNFNANAGVSLALSERTTVSTSLTYVYYGPTEVDGYEIPQAANEAIVLRNVLIQRVGKSLYIEPSVNFGLTDVSSDVVLGLALRKRW